MFNFLDAIKASPGIYRQLAVDDQLISEFNCPLETNKETMWTNQGYFVYVIAGKKIWHVPGHSFEMKAGNCIFVKQGAHIIEQFFDAQFCVVVFFVSDRFIVDTLRQNNPPKPGNMTPGKSTSIFPVDADDSLHAFFNSVVPYFLTNREVSKNLLELKFKELILNVVNNVRNSEINAHFYSLLTDDHCEVIRKILEDNFQYNIGLEEYAKMCGRSLSAFKRDFENHFKTTPGRWLLERRLQHAELLLNTSAKQVGEIAFESGFENISHFSRAFKKRFGESPKKYKGSVT